MSSRLQQLFGVTAPWLLQPKRAALTCTTAWVITLPLTRHHPWMALLGFVAIWALTLALSVEAPLLQSLPLPPLTVLLFGLCLRWGIGPILMSVGGSGGDTFIDIWIQYGPQAQFLWLIFTAALLLYAFLQKPAISKAANFQPQSTWLRYALQHPHVHLQLKILAVVLSIYMLAYIALSLISGAFDRQFDAYVSWTNTLWRLDTPVAAFSRLRDLWFLLFPLWWSLLRGPLRWFLSIELISFLLSASLSGSRGLLFYPALLLLFGLWLVLNEPRRIRSLALAIALIVFLLSPVIYVLRDSKSFQDANSWDQRIHALGLTLMQPEPLLQKARWLGRDLYACHDPYLFTPLNSIQPPVGFRGLEKLPYIWIPKHIFPDRQSPFDGHLIAKQLQRITPSDWSKVWFPCFSLPADLMRRWSIPGVLLGSLVIASFVQILLNSWYRTVSSRPNTFQLLLLFFPATYLQSFPFGTVSESFWFLLWELPKYLVMLWLTGTVVDRLVARTNL